MVDNAKKNKRWTTIDQQSHSQKRSELTKRILHRMACTETLLQVTSRNPQCNLCTQDLQQRLISPQYIVCNRMLPEVCKENRKVHNNIETIGRVRAY